MVQRSLVFRLNLAILMIVGATSLLLVLTSSYYLYSKTLSDMRLDAEQTVTLAQLSLIDRLWDFDSDGVKDIASSLLIDDKFAVIAIKDKMNVIQHVLHADQYREVSLEDYDPDDFFKVSRTINRDRDEIALLEILISKQPARQRMVELVAYIVLASLVLLILLTSTMALAADHLIKKPILKLRGETHEIITGNLLSPIDVTRDDELGELARDFAQMRDSIREKIAIIEGHNHTLEDKVRERTWQLEQKHNETLAVFKSLKEGILTFSDPRRIDPEYSPYLAKIFETETIAHTPVIDLLLAHASTSKDQGLQLLAAIEAMLGSDAVTFDMNSSLLLREIAIQIAERRKILDLSWSPVVNADNIIEKMVLTIRDVTELQAIRELSRANQKNFRILQELIDCQASAFSLFFPSFESKLQIVRDQLESGDAFSIKQAMVSLHTIKGNARTYGFSALSSKIHEIESVLHEDGSDHGRIEHSDRIIALVDELRSIYEQYQLVRHKIFHAAQAEIQAHFGVSFESILKSMQSGDLQAIQEQGLRLGHLLSSEDLGSALETLSLSTLPSIARDCGKPLPILKVMGHAPALAPPMMEVLNDAIVHLFRNSIDHGLEAAHVRQQLGKMIRGTITIEIEEKAQHVEISYQDDGQGVNLIYAREVMMQKGLLESNQPLTRDMLLKAIFMDGFSTARRLSEVSGRGIGMNAIRTLLQTRGGTFNCEILEESLFDVGYASLRFTMILPLDSVRSQDAS